MKNLMTIAIALAFSSTVAVADSHTEKKKAPDAAKKEEPKKDVKKEEPKKEAPKAAPKAPKEIEDMAKAMAGNWKCTGKGVMDPADPTKWTEMTGTMKSALDLDKWWIKGEYTAKVAGATMKGTMYTTFDGKKWHRHSMDNMGGSNVASAAAPAAGAKVSWEGEERMGGMSMKSRSTEELSAKEMKITAEGSMDGKKWAPTFEMTCKK